MRRTAVLGLIAAALTLGACGGSNDESSASSVDPADAKKRLVDAEYDILIYCTAKELAPVPTKESNNQSDSVDDLTALVADASEVEVKGGTTVETEVIRIIGHLEENNCDAAAASQLDRALDAAN